jgi:hypothetical protein
MKQIEILPLKKRNEISFFLFRKTSKILWNNFLFRIVSCFVTQKKEEK